MNIIVFFDKRNTTRVRGRIGFRPAIPDRLFVALPWPLPLPLAPVIGSRLARTNRPCPRPRQRLGDKMSALRRRAFAMFEQPASSAMFFGSQSICSSAEPGICVRFIFQPQLFAFSIRMWHFSRISRT